MGLVFRNQYFGVSRVPKSRKIEDYDYFSVDIVFKDEADKDAHACAHVKWLAQNAIRESRAIESGKKDRPKGFEPYPLEVVATHPDGKIPDNWNPKSNATINSDGSVQPTTASRVEELLKTNTIEALEAAIAAAKAKRTNG